MSDQELDDLFKEASAKYEAPYDDKEWEKMAALLDAPPSVKTPFWNWKTLSVAALLITMGSVLVITQWDTIGGENRVSKSAMDSSKENVPATEGTEEMTTESEGRQKSNEGQSSLDSSSVTPTKQELTQIESAPEHNALQPGEQGRNAQPKQTSQNNSQETNSISENKIVKKSNLKSGKKVVTDGENKQSSRISKENNSPVINTEQQPSLAVRSTTESESLRQINGSQKENTKNTDSLSPDKESHSSLKEARSTAVAEIKKTTSKETPDEAIVENQRAESLSSDTSAKTAVVKTNQESASVDSAKAVIAPMDKKDSVAVKEVKEEEKQKDSLDRVQRFSVRLALSPDFSSIGYFKPDKSGFNYGLLGEYNITRHWSVTVGAIWSKKIYSDLKTETSGSGTVKSTQMKGSCRVLDLPLNINYYFTPQNTFSLYTSVGLSSYMMFDEDYTYDYINGSKSYSYEGKIDKGNKEWFRMMNISIGIQQRLSPQLRLQLEPFVKAPLSGIGGGDLKLVSSGVFVNLKYTFK